MSDNSIFATKGLILALALSVPLISFTPDPVEANALRGGLIGAGGGALFGAIVGGGRGAAAGAIVGGFAGAVIGSERERERRARARRRMYNSRR